MRSILNIYLCVVGMAVCFTANGANGEAWFRESFALVIGIDKYLHPEWEDLSFAVADARAMAEFFKDQGFKVKTLYDAEATRYSIIRYIESDWAVQVGPNDRVVVFFAGHGHTRVFAGGVERGYIVPYDGNSETASLIAMPTLLDLAAILEIVRHQLFIMDTCYGGRLGMRGRQEYLDPDIPHYLEEVSKRKARQILTAGGATQRVVDQGENGHSVFTGELLNGLRLGRANSNGDAYITFYELANYIQVAASRSNQSPGVDFMEGHQQGEFIFADLAWFNRNNIPYSGPVQVPMGDSRGRDVFELLRQGKQRLAAEEYEHARPLLAEAADLGSNEAVFLLGVVVYKHDGRLDEGLALVQQAADKGFLDAMKALREYYEHPNSRNLTEAAYWAMKVRDAEQVALRISLVDPTGVEREASDDIPAPIISLQPPAAPSNLQAIP